MKNTNKKLLVVTIVSLVLAIVCVVGTLAYLTSVTDKTTNTFTMGKVNITLTEENPTDKDAIKMTPGNDIEKDPTINVIKGSEDCWVFVKIEETALTNYIEYTVDSKWIKLEDGVYYLEHAQNNSEDVAYAILTGNKVTVKSDVTGIAEGDVPTLSFTGYAIQKSDSIANAAAAWAEFNPVEASTNE